jgi:hypothetical protein
LGLERGAWSLAGNLHRAPRTWLRFYDEEENLVLIESAFEAKRAETARAHAEAARARAEASQAQSEAAKAQAEAERARAEAALEEVARLKALLEAKGIGQ